MKSRLQVKYDQYRKNKPHQKKGRFLLRAFMPEMIFRTTKLEGEPVTRRMVNAIFKWAKIPPNQKVQPRTNKQLSVLLLEQSYFP